MGLGESREQDFGQMLSTGGLRKTSVGGKTAEGQGDKRRLEDYDDAMRRIKDATGVSDVNEII